MSCCLHASVFVIELSHEGVPIFDGLVRLKSYGGGPGAGGFVWLHFNLANVATPKWMHDNLMLSDVFHEALKDGSRCTRAELEDEILIVVINDVHYDFAFEPSDISTMWLSVSPTLVVSARLQPLRSIDRLRDAVNCVQTGQRELTGRKGSQEARSLLSMALNAAVLRKMTSPVGIWMTRISCP